LAYFFPLITFPFPLNFIFSFFLSSFIFHVFLFFVLSESMLCLYYVEILIKLFSESIWKLFAFIFKLIFQLLN
jgi:hypothetical protein